MLVKFSDYDASTLKFSSRKLGKLMTFRSTVNHVYIQYPWIKCGKFVVPDDKFCKTVEERACLKLKRPDDEALMSFLMSIDTQMSGNDFLSQHKLTEKHLHHRQVEKGI